MKKVNYILMLFAFVAVSITSCKKEDIRPVTSNDESTELIMKNDSSDEGYRATKDDESSTEENDSNSDGKVVSNGNNVIVIDNITDPNNDEDDKGKIGLKK